MSQIALIYINQIGPLGTHSTRRGLWTSALSNHGCAFKEQTSTTIHVQKQSTLHEHALY